MFPTNPINLLTQEGSERRPIEKMPESRDCKWWIIDMLSSETQFKSRKTPACSCLNARTYFFCCRLWGYTSVTPTRDFSENASKLYREPCVSQERDTSERFYNIPVHPTPSRRRSRITVSLPTNVLPIKNARAVVYYYPVLPYRLPLPPHSPPIPSYALPPPLPLQGAFALICGCCCRSYGFASPI